MKNVIEFSLRNTGHSFFRATVHMWQRARSNEQAFKIGSLPLKDQWLNWPFNFTWLIAKFAFWKIKMGDACLVLNSIDIGTHIPIKGHWLSQGTTRFSFRPQVNKNKKHMNTLFNNILKIWKGQSETVNQRMTDKRKRTIIKIMIYKTLHRKHH